ncbi:hypothetical protein [Escherichia coli ISC41]|nr:hypothetical protein [Escherichia coli ISC41]
MLSYDKSGDVALEVLLDTIYFRAIQTGKQFSSDDGKLVMM